MAALGKEGALSAWDSFWLGLTPESEIRMWDFYGGRPWVLKHTPRHGKVVEAGCGLGRYVFYLSRLGIDVEGLDFNPLTVEAVSRWGGEHGFSCKFLAGVARHLPYEAGSLSGYVSFGVIEHFQEGPQQALAEAFRVLRPGGIAIISTPSPSFAIRYLHLRRGLRNVIKRLLGRPIPERSFFQHWYSPGQLAASVRRAGLHVQMAAAIDLSYSFWELGGRPEGRMIGFWLTHLLERTPLAAWGALSFTISVKVADQMHCFLCGRNTARKADMVKHYVPICPGCSRAPIASCYVQRRTPSFHVPWLYGSPAWLHSARQQACYFCQELIQPDAQFEHFGFSVPVCDACLRDAGRNLELSNRFLQPCWRPRQAGQETRR